jgi:hypothetical protein
MICFPVLVRLLERLLQSVGILVIRHPPRLIHPVLDFGKQLAA